MSKNSKSVSEFLSSINQAKIKAMAFNFGEIKDPNYGTAVISGEIPFVTPPGKLEIPTILLKEGAIDKLAREEFIHCRNAFPDLLDEELISMLKDLATYHAIFPPIEITPERLKIVTLFGTCGAALDDLIDSGDTEKPNGNDESSATSYKVFNITLQDATSKTTKDIHEILDYLPNIHSSIQGIKELGNYAAKKGRESFPNLHARALEDEDFVTELCRLIQSSLAFKEFTKSGQYYSIPTMMEMFRYCTGYILLPYTLFFRTSTDFKLNSFIRNDILYVSMMNNWADIGSNFNAMFGLFRDLEKNQDDSPIMYLMMYHKWSLQKAFDFIYQWTLNSISDFKMNSQKLLQVYPNDKDLAETIDYLGRGIDGCIIMHKISERYKVQDLLSIVYDDS